MKSYTESCVVQKPKNEVFEFLSKIENLPKWGSEFVKSVKLIDGKFKATTPIGEMFFKFVIDEPTGVIDMYSGLTEDNLTLAPMRIIKLYDNVTAVTFTIFKHPEVDNQSWHLFCEYIKKEIQNIERLFS